MYTVSVEDVSSFIKEIRIANEQDKPDEFYRPKELLFRGQSNVIYELIPSLGRYKNGQGDIFLVERNMIEMAKYYMPSVFKKDLEPLELLCLLQHYGIPTRLLDVTENSLVALFFACQGSQDKDGEVLIFKNFVDDVVDYPIFNAIADSYRFSRGSFYYLKLFYEEVIRQPYFLEQKYMVETTKKDSNKGGEWVKKCCEKPLFVRGTQMLQRQLIQSGRYILFHNEISNNEYDSDECFLPRIKAMSKDDECIIGRISIPAKSKEYILNDLKLLGINRRMLFSDSIDISCEEIKKCFYSK